MILSIIIIIIIIDWILSCSTDSGRLDLGFLTALQTMVTLVHQCLQSIHMAGMNQSYLFLWPYADPNNAVPIPCAMLAQHTVKESNLLCDICSMAEEACALLMIASDEHPDQPVQDGLGYFSSWPAVCVIKGLAW